YRVEGKKTMGLELAEQFSWSLPDVIVYPTGGGTGIIGMWKAFDELEQLGFIDSQRPRMISVQSSTCAPIVKAFKEGKDHAEFWEDAHTIAAGLRVPSAIADYLILKTIRDSKGTAIAVDDLTIKIAMNQLAKEEGIMLSKEEKVVIFGTGSGLTTPEEW
ncbi:MAG: pyridoxal-phosphate dependent enzyme, partial [Candidatus Heimdallarchaeaceae archaeon]